MSRSIRRAVITSAIAGATAPAIAAPAYADHPAYAIVLPGAISAEGIASGSGSIFYASDMFSGDIFRGDIRKGSAAKFIHNTDGRNALGLRVDIVDNMLFAAGGFNGKGYVYSPTTGAALASYQFSTAPSLINDVALTSSGAWFTNSFQPGLYFVPIINGRPGSSFTTIHLSGPAAAIDPEGINNSGIPATPNGSALVVAHSRAGTLNLVNPTTGASRAVQGLSLSNVDGILMQGRTVYAGQTPTFRTQISEVQLSADFTSGSVKKVVTSSLFEIPTTVGVYLANGVPAVFISRFRRPGIGRRR